MQAGCRVQQLVEALKPHGLTLQVKRGRRGDGRTESAGELGGEGGN